MTSLLDNGLEQQRSVGDDLPRSLFIVSHKDRDGLAELAAQCGWKATAKRRSDSAERHYLSGDATVALIDVRNGKESLIDQMGSAVEASGGALIALIEADYIHAVPRLMTAGATHFIVAPVLLPDLAAILASADTMVSRLSGRAAFNSQLQHPVSAPRDMERDFLTGLSSRHAAVQWLEEQLKAEGKPLVLLLSIGPFDRINAAYGQMAGDALLGRIARRVERMVEEHVGADAMTARIAGTEYMVGAPAGIMGADRAVFLARRIIGAISQPFSAGDHLIRLTGRCGIAEAVEGDSATRLLRRAGTALADAKQADGEGIRILTARERSRDADPDRLESDLRLALDRGEIDIVFQPQYACDDNRLTGVEALARWSHPHYGAVGAGALFSAAERSDFLLPLSAHIQAEALRQAAAWPRTLSDLRLSLNVTASDISQPQFLEDFLATVDGSGFPRSRLTVEITESGLIEDIAAAAALLDRLRAEGLAVAIDDFGTGYSSLAYLKALPLDYLKIDSGLAQDIAGSEHDRIIVRGVIDMARALGMKVIAEGVETEEQRALLAVQGCSYYQGFLKSAAVSAADLAALVDR